ncbi:hypothetical protein OG689_19595 [Kitasatospora sp. NBC_00240]|uniref:hypothetical protein n=1 Tax=Kitasatospora sp. NBC_00240 TaxID=2903567 RepID=UPI002252F15A|nr:hypothetical protein [Kitasatospora sp. NBC_00240]MCX5211466.1 hypothetical protein [Kitasatospora sp. NBC_00240]
MNPIEITHAVSRAGAAFGFAVMAITGMAIYYSRGRSFTALKSKSVWLPWSLTAVTMVLASAVTGGFISSLSGSLTGTGNKGGAVVGHAALGQDADGAVKVSAARVLSYSGSWIVLVLLVAVILFIWFAKSWKERALAVSGALTGATWGITSALGGWAAMIGVPLVSWIGKVVIG